MRLTSHALLTFLALTASAAMAMPASAQDVDPVVTPPPTLVLANYDNVPVGPFGGLEGSAHVARVSDSSAAWFNPAGLSREATSQISGSAGVYQFTSVSPQALPHSGGSLQQVPNFVGFTLPIREGVTAGLALLTTNSWIQETDLQSIGAVPSGQERFAYSADSEFTRRILAVGVGIRGHSAWRVGGGVAFSLMNLRLVQSVSDRVADPAGLSTLLVAARMSGSAIQLRSQGGVQYDTPKFRLGAAIRTPGLTMHRSGGITLDGTLNSGASSLGGSVFDPNARLDYHLPWELQGGAAYVHNRFEVELDVQGYTAIPAYSLLSTGEPAVIYSDTGATAPSVTSRPFSGLTSASDGVVNVAVGGRVRILKNRDLRIHGGFATSQSPVADEDEIFTKADMSSWTVGVSGSVAKFQFSAGLNYRAGTATDILLLNRVQNGPQRANIDLRTAGFIYSIAYQF